MQLLVALLLLLLAGCGSVPSASAPSARPTPVPAPQAVVISVDGLRGDAASRGDLPNLAALAARGCHTWQAQTINPSNTLPSHVSMLSGYPVAVHQVSWDDYLPAKGKIVVPTLFTLTRTTALRSVMVVGKQKFDHFKDTGFVDSYVLTLRGDDDVANQAIVQVQSGFELMFVHLPDLDLTGHKHGWMSASYLDTLRVADTAIGRLIAALPERTTIVLTADHGGHDLGHGTTLAADTTIPWVIAGPAIRSGVTLTTRVSTLDTTATVARVLGLSTAADLQGKAVAEAFLN